MRLLEVEAHRQFIATPERPAAPFSAPLFLRLYYEWTAWKRGMPPGREWKGRGGQNPHWLQAMDALDRAEARAIARASEPQPESREAFEARIKREVGTG